MKTRNPLISDHHVLLLPAVVILALITVVPFFYLVGVSFSNLSMPQITPLRLVWFQNWLRMFGDAKVWQSWSVSAMYISAGIVLELALGILIALSIHSLRRSQEIIVSICILPLFLAPVVVGLLWRFLLHDSYGLYAYVLHTLGLFEGSSILGSGGTALASVIVMDVWEWTPLITLIVLGGLKTLPHEPFEAAALDGVTRFGMIRHVTLPLLKSTIAIAVIIRSMDILRDYTKILITTGGGPADATKDISMRLAEIALEFFDLGYASAIALTVLAVIIILAKSFLGFFYRREGY